MFKYIQGFIYLAILVVISNSVFAEKTIGIIAIVKTLTFATEATYPPFELVSSSGKLEYALKNFANRSTILSPYKYQ